MKLRKSLENPPTKSRASPRGESRRDGAPADKVWRYSLSLPRELQVQIEAVAEKNHTTVVDVLRRFVKLGLLAVQIEETPGAELLIREGEIERRLIFL